MACAECDGAGEHAQRAGQWACAAEEDGGDGMGSNRRLCGSVLGVCWECGSGCMCGQHRAAGGGGGTGSKGASRTTMMAAGTEGLFA